MSWIEHTTCNNERWDEIAYKYYGNCFLFNQIMDANPQVPKEPFLPNGIIIKIPVEKTEAFNNNLPPWKR